MLGFHNTENTTQISCLLGPACSQICTKFTGIINYVGPGFWPTKSHGNQVPRLLTQSVRTNLTEIRGASAVCPARFERLACVLLSPMRPLAHGLWSSRSSKFLSTVLAGKPFAHTFYILQNLELLPARNTPQGFHRIASSAR